MNENLLTNCELEPIHIPGKIQGHGFLLATDLQFNVTHCSENISKFLLLETFGVLGKSLNSLPGFFELNGEASDLSSTIRVLLRQQKRQQAIRLDQLVNGTTFNLSVYTTGQGYIFEFEPELSDLQADIQGVVGRSLSEMLSDKNFSSLLTNATDQVRKIIGYDRVMIYKFHGDGHGEVVGESKNDTLEPWLGLHYPAADIPVQARELYKLNLVRLIADVHSIPSAILALPSHADPLDLTHNSLRAVSPVHIQYLINMGVASSFSISIMDQDQLWGLIACHNYTPRFINVDQRESAKLVGQVLSSALSFREQEQGQKLAASHRSAIENITRYLLRNIPIQEALTAQPEANLIHVLGCDGAAMHYENEFYTMGKVPPSDFLIQLIKWLDQQTYRDGYYMSNHLPADFPEALAYKDIASGLLACRLGKDLNEYLLWFRPEVLSTITWAGEPVKSTNLDKDGILQISPRNSFSEWTQMVILRSKDWGKQDLDAAMALRDEVNYAVSRKANELRIINEQLRLAYAELDTFTYTISHDLKNPLTTIKSFSQLIFREKSDLSKIHAMSERITLGTERMQGMIDEVLRYSKVGQSKIQAKSIDMQKMLDELRNDLLISYNNSNLEINLLDTPAVFGDELMVFQVFSNLVGNAVKYSSKASRPCVTVSGTLKEGETIYSIMDNGIGIPSDQHSSIFELFSRARTSGDFEGTGVGLAIVKRILEKHNGRIWLESTEGRGTTFYVGFKFLEQLSA